MALRTLVVDWMVHHADEIVGLDHSRPLVVQLDRLTDEQLVGLVKAVDPTAAVPLSSLAP